VVQDTFVRIEDKFLVNNGLRDRLIALVEDHCKPAYPETGTSFTLVESIYFDSENLDLYQNHFSNLETRFKLRVRRYAPNGNWDEGAAFLEAKSKIRTEAGSICSKKRFRIDKHNLNFLVESKEILVTKALASLNPKMSHADLLERVAFVNDIVKTYHLLPQLRIQYERVAFEGEGVRVTFDKNIQFENLHEFSPEMSRIIRGLNLWSTASGMKKLYSRDDYLVCEVKYSASIPSWLEGFFIQNKIEKVSFSKYCWGLTNLIDRQEDTIR
jgi:SPX domain protein involved in polyphosphate accumulation